ncbi:MAG: mechanosensitive ion channel family protein [Solirubrobacteraceae bacterium]
MPASTVGLPLAAAFWAENSDVVTAVISIVLAVVVATVLDRSFARRGHAFAEAVTRGHMTPVLDTRLRFIRRLIYATILLIGIAIALSQFTGLSKLATSVLASGALAAAIIGFAARQTLANVVAGIMLAVTQPLRVGDWVTFEEEYGVVEDVRLNYTVLRTPGDVRVVIPNERLAAGILRNDTLGSDRIALDVSVWLAPGADVQRALAVLADATDSKVAVAEITPDGVRIQIAGDPVPPHERGPRQAELRALCLARLHSERLLDGGGQGIAPA